MNSEELRKYLVRKLEVNAKKPVIFYTSAAARYEYMVQALDAIKSAEEEIIQFWEEKGNPMKGIQLSVPSIKKMQLLRQLSDKYPQEDC